jgi:hypothetical protein
MQSTEVIIRQSNQFQVLLTVRIAHGNQLVEDHTGFPHMAEIDSLHSVFIEIHYDAVEQPLVFHLDLL